MLYSLLPHDSPDYLYNTCDILYDNLDKVPESQAQGAWEELKTTIE